MSADDKALIAQMRQEIAELKEQTKPYRAGDTMSISYMEYVVAGLISNSTTRLRFSIVLDYPIEAKSFSVTYLSLTCRTTDGAYLDGWPAGGQNVVTDAYTVTGYVCSKRIVHILVSKKDGTFSNVVNNTPVAISLYTVRLAFSDKVSSDPGISEGPEFEGMD